MALPGTPRSVDDPLALPAIAAIPDVVEGRWWVAHTRPRAEKALAADLSRIDVFHYLPLRERMTRSRTTGRVSRSQVPVFSSYLFFVATNEQRYLAMRTNRIVNTLRVPNQAQLVAELRHIHTVLATGTPFLRRSQLKIGRWVRIVAGPLMGVEGVVASCRSPFRIVINVDILGQSVTVEADVEAVEPIDVPPYARDSGSTAKRRAARSR
jgi:transcription antitermination factor NusG